MANKILKGFAVAAGTGLAIGLGSKRHLEESEFDMEASSDNLLHVETMLNRLDGIEERIGSLETSMQTAAAIRNADLEAFQNQVDALQNQAADTRQRLAAEVAILERRFTEITEEVPAILESLLAPKIEDLHARLRAETEESLETSLKSFERLIESKVSLRMAALEKVMIEQSGTISALSQRALESDMNMQRLVGAVERLAERPAAPPPPQQFPPIPHSPFERNLSDAIKRAPEQPPPTVNTGFRPRIIMDEEGKLRHRVPLTRI